MTIKKRSFPIYVLLNCLTLGIYGLIVSMEINKEIDAICKGDNEAPRFSYLGAVMFRGIAPIVGLIVGLILGLAGIDTALNFIPGFEEMFLVLSFIPGMGAIKAILVFLSMFVFGILFTAAGSLISGIYLKYWWYKQANRLKLNAGRYGLVVKESGTDNFMFRTAMEVLFIPISVILFALSFAIPAFIIWLITLAESIGAIVFAAVLLLLFALPLMFFGMELTTGANFAMFFMFKNLNRFADVYRNGAAPFDPMAYEYYPSVSKKYPNFIPNLMDKKPPEGTSRVDPPPTVILHRTLVGINGSCAGYNFDLTPGEEIIIGKDAKVSQVVIDPAYKEISRKHVGVCYDLVRNQYRVVDYSSNGTWANGSKLIRGQEVYLPCGTELKLANDKNIFRLD